MVSSAAFVSWDRLTGPGAVHGQPRSWRATRARPRDRAVLPWPLRITLFRSAVFELTRLAHACRRVDKLPSDQEPLDLERLGIATPLRARLKLCTASDRSRSRHSAGRPIAKWSRTTFESPACSTVNEIPERADKHARGLASLG